MATTALPLTFQHDKISTMLMTSDGCLILNIPTSKNIQIAWNRQAFRKYKRDTFVNLQIDSISGEDSFADNSTHRGSALKYMEEKNEEKLLELMVNLYNSVLQDKTYSYWNAITQDCYAILDNYKDYPSSVHASNAQYLLNMLNKSDLYDCIRFVVGQNFNIQGRSENESVNGPENLSNCTLLKELILGDMRNLIGKPCNSAEAYAKKFGFRILKNNNNIRNSLFPTLCVCVYMDGEGVIVERLDLHSGKHCVATTGC